MPNIKLRFINESNDSANSNVVIFQKNVADDFDEIAVAWQVIKNCGKGLAHNFEYPMDFGVGIKDSWGNESLSLSPATNGDAFAVSKELSGDMLGPDGYAVSNKEVEVKNNLSLGSIEAQIYRNGNLLAIKPIVSPGEKAVFKFKPKIFIGIASQIQQGEVMDSAVISQFKTELDLLGVSSADIIMRGGGSGPDATGFSFTLENVQ